MGLQVVEKAINAKEDPSLYDNAKGFSNYAAPGADRLKIELVLSKKAVDDPDFEPRYVPKAPDNDFVTMYDTDLKQNVTVFKNTVVESDYSSSLK